MEVKEISKEKILDEFTQIRTHSELSKKLSKIIHDEQEKLACEVGASMYELRRYKEHQVLLLSQIQYVTGAILAKQHMEIKILKRMMIFMICAAPIIFISTHYIIKYALEYFIK